MKTSSVAARCRTAFDRLADVPNAVMAGRVAGVSGLGVDIAGLNQHLTVGERLNLQGRSGTMQAEIIGFRGSTAQAMTFGAPEGLGPGAAATVKLCATEADHKACLRVSNEWIGRVIDPLGRPLDGKGPLTPGPGRAVRVAPPVATLRARLGPRLDLGVRVLNAFTTCRQGQRLGLFAGSGVGKSTLLAMLARHSKAEVVVLALVGERGREVREFLEDDLGEAGRTRCVTVIATSDTPPLMRREAAYAAMTVAEYFRDQGRSVLLLMDSVTRFCLALREIGLSAGEPPATRGYPPSVFAELPRLLERAGPGIEGPNGAGQITALFTVLVEGDDHNEPVADSVRGILDGHVVLERKIGEGGRYPAVDVLRSLSRTVPGCNEPGENALARRARSIMGLASEMADLVRLGAYQKGSDPAVDEALAMAPRIEAALRQDREEYTDLEGSFARLKAAMEV